MAIQGTGLPLPKDQGIPSPITPVVNMESHLSAAAWGSIARSGAEIANTGADLWKLDEHQRQVGYLADQEIDAARMRTDLRNQYANDPAGFDNAWKGYTDGKIANAEPWAIPHIKRTLGAEGNGAYAAILGEKRATDTRLDSEKISTLAQQSSSDYVASAMAGNPDPARLEKFKGVLATAVTSRLMTQEKADMLLDETAGRAQGEVAARDAVEVYKSDGYEAAINHLRQNVLENESLGLKPAEKRKAFSRGLEAITLERRVDREDRVGLVDEAKDTMARLQSNQPIDAGTVQSQLSALKRVGAWSAYRDLYVQSQVSDLTAPYRTGAQRPADFAKTIGDLRDGNAPRGIRNNNPLNIEAGQFTQSQPGFAGSDGRFAKFATPEQGTAAAGELLARYGKQGISTISGVIGKWAPASENDVGAYSAFVAQKLGVAPGDTIDLNDPGTRSKLVSAMGEFENGRPISADASGGQYQGIIVKRAQQEFAAQMRKEWPDFQKQIKAGKQVDPEDFDAIRMAAAVSGDAAWIKDVEEANQARVLGKVVSAAPITRGQTALDEIKQKFTDNVSAAVKEQFDRRVKMVTEDPVGFAVEGGRPPPAPLDFSNPQAAQGAVRERVNIARAVAQDQQVQPGNPFRPAETTAMAGAIISGKPETASAALGSLTSLPDDMLVPALKNAEIRSAITGATRSTDPARYNAAMMFADGLWQRAPETAKAVLGDDAIHSLMTWQSNLRYMTPDQLAKEREKLSGDPQVRQRQQANESEGRKLARAMDPGEVVKQFDTSWWITPGPIARAMGSQPLAPGDAGTRDALMGDYENIFARRYAETLDKDTAAKQTLEILKTKWQRSEVNGGRLMLRAPETTYPAVNGNWRWMTDRLESDLAEKLGPRFETGPSTDTNWDYNIVADRRTDAEAQAGQPPSYSIVVTDRKTGKTDVVKRDDGKEFRYVWDAGPDQEKARTEFAIERQRVFNYNSLHDNPLRF